MFIYSVHNLNYFGENIPEPTTNTNLSLVNTDHNYYEVQTMLSLETFCNKTVLFCHICDNDTAEEKPPFQ